MGLVLKIALGIIVAVFVISYLFEAKVTVGPATTPTTTVSQVDVELCNEGNQASCRAIGR